MISLFFMANLGEGKESNIYTKKEIVKDRKMY